MVHALKLDSGFHLFCKENTEALAAKFDKRKALWDELSEEDKGDFETRAAREAIDAIWEAARKKGKISGWVLFVKEMSKEMDAGTPFLARNAQISAAWRALSEHDKEVYNKKADKENEIRGFEKTEKKAKKDKKETKDKDTEEEEKPAKKEKKKAAKKDDEKKESEKKTKKTGDKKEGTKRKESEKKEDKKEEKKEKKGETEGEKPKKKPALKKKKVVAE